MPGLASYPVNLVLGGRLCLVVGGGPVAAGKVAGLLSGGARVRLVATRLGPEVRALACAQLACHERPYRAEDLDGCWLVVSATGERAVDRTVAADAARARTWVNVADDPAACSFTLPAVARQGPVQVAVSTGGLSPALAAWLRDAIAAGLGPEHAELARMLASARDELKAAGRSTEGLDWQKALDSDMLGLVRAGQVDQARERLRACLSSS